jgi:hypothetical protein
VNEDIDNSINTNMDWEHFEGLGIYKIFNMPEGARNESAAPGTNVHQSSRRRRQMVDSSIELTHQEFLDMVSANDVQVANDRASRKVREFLVLMGVLIIGTHGRYPTCVLSIGVQPILRR